MAYQIFEFAAVFTPKPKTVNGETVQDRGLLVVDVQRVLASSQQEATILASRAIPTEYLDKLDQVVISVRPF